MIVLFAIVSSYPLFSFEIIEDVLSEVLLNETRILCSIIF